MSAGAYATPMKENRPTTRSRLNKVLYGVLVAIVVVIVFFPIYWMIVSSIQPTKYSTHFPPPLIPRGINGDVFRELFGKYPITDWLIRSTMISVAATVICIFLS